MNQVTQAIILQEQLNQWANKTNFDIIFSVSDPGIYMEPAFFGLVIRIQLGKWRPWKYLPTYGTPT